MSHNPTNMYDIDLHIAEIYDSSEAYTDDVDLIRELISGRGPLRILEPFCGTGRILIPLAMDGHEIVGIDQAGSMLDRAHMKILNLPREIRERLSLIQADVTREDWTQITGSKRFDLVILAGNCFYELATSEEQERCIEQAAKVLDAGGYLYLDNDRMEAGLAPSWQLPGERPGFPTGVCADGTVVESTVEVVWWDVPRRLVRFRRRTKVTRPDGLLVESEYLQQKHPVSSVEMQGWLSLHGFEIQAQFGNRDGNPLTPDSERAIFWAQLFKNQSLE